MRMRAAVAAVHPGMLPVIAIVMLGALASPGAAQHRVERTAQLNHDGEFRIWNFVGSVRVEAWDVDSVRVEGTMDDVARAGFVFGANGASGKMATESDGRTGHADLLIRVPRRATVWVKTMSAPVVVAGVAGVIDVHSVSGPVDIDASAQSVYAESMGGRVRATGRSSVVRLRTGSGRIEFDGAATDLSLTSVGGDILARAGDLRRGIVETVGGRVHLGVGLAHGASLEILTHDGDVDLTVPSAVSARFMLRTISGTIRTASGLDDRSGGRRSPGRETSFVAGRGGADVEVRTFSGGIIVRTP